MSTITVDAVFEDGVLRPVQTLRLNAHQRVTLIVQVPEQAEIWPEDTATIYQEIADEDRRLAAVMGSSIRQTWPASEEQP